MNLRRRGARSRFAILLLVSALVLSPLSSVPVEATQTQQAAGNVFIERQAFEQTPEPGDVLVHVTYEIPDSVTDVRVGLPDGTRVTETDGFDLNGDHLFWTGGSTASFTARYSLPKDRVTSDRGGDPGPWAIVTTFNPDADLWFEGSRPGRQIEVSVVGKGAAGHRWAYLGPVAETRTNRGELTVRYITPRNGSAPDSAKVFDFIDVTDDHLGGVGPREVTVFVLPDHPARERSSIGIGARGGGDLLIWSGAPLDRGSDSVLVHEFVHTQTRGDYATDMQWFVEAIAEYFGSTVAMREGEGGFYEFVRVAAPNEEENVTLTNPATWRGDSNYDKGLLVLTVLQLRLHEASDGQYSIVDVFRRILAQQGHASYSDFRNILVDFAGPELGRWADRHIAGDALPSPSWVSTANLSAFATSTGDTDGDGLVLSREIELEIDPFRADTDNDGLSDSEEVKHGTDPGDYDTDRDGVRDSKEVHAGTDPLSTDDANSSGGGDTDKADSIDGQHATTTDSDQDGLPDEEETQLGTDPTRADTDGDGLTDEAEARADSDPLVVDTDSDGLFDAKEQELGTRPDERDSDHDEISDKGELRLGTNPMSSDTDRDGSGDSFEIALGSDPSQPTPKVELFLRGFPWAAGQLAADLVDIVTGIGEYVLRALR